MNAEIRGSVQCERGYKLFLVAEISLEPEKAKFVPIEWARSCWRGNKSAVRLWIHFASEFTCHSKIEIITFSVGLLKRGVETICNYGLRSGEICEILADVKEDSVRINIDTAFDNDW